MKPTALTLPTWACDTHVHLSNSVTIAGDAWKQEIATHLTTLGLARGVLVESQFSAIGKSDFMHAVQNLGAHFRGVITFDRSVNAVDLAKQAQAGIAGVRVFFAQLGDEDRDALFSLTPVMADLGMHVQILLNTHLHMQDAAAFIRRLHLPVIIDHAGWPDLRKGPDEPGFMLLCDLLAEGLVYVKLSALYRLCPPPYHQADTFVQRLLASNPDHLLWGSDWPHLVNDHSLLPKGGAIMDLFLRLVKSPELRQKILSDAPARLYHFS